jgi:hypothetical protein
MYLDVTIVQKAEALATLEDENNRKAPKKWKRNNSRIGKRGSPTGLEGSRMSL